MGAYGIVGGVVALVALLAHALFLEIGDRLNENP